MARTTQKHHGNHRTVYKRSKLSKRTLDADQVAKNLTPEKIQEIENRKADPFLPGAGKFYCIPCDRYFISQNAYDDHLKGGQHRLRLREAKDGGFTPKQAQECVGIDIGQKTFQVGELKKSGQNNIEAILNSQSKRFSQTLIGYDGEQFFVGEHAQQFARKNPGPIFSGFIGSVSENITKFAVDPNAPELEDIVQYDSILLTTALLNHIVTNMVKPGENTTVDITLIHSPSYTLPQLSAIKQAIEQLPNCNLFLTVPTPAAVIITHLSTRMKDFNKETGQQFIVIDSGAALTEVSVLQAKWNEQTQDTEINLIHNEELKAGGNNITECMVNKFVLPKLQGRQITHKLQKKIYDATEKAKIVLSGQNFTKINIENALPGGEDFSAQISREQLNQCVSEIFTDENIEPFQNTAFYLDSDFDEDSTFYLFYGGNTRIPAIQSLFEDFFGAQVLKSVNQDEGSIYGAGLLTARQIVGFKVGNRFNVFDQTRPWLYYENEKHDEYEQLYKLNPSVKYSFETDFPEYSNDTFKLTTGTFSVNTINETYYYETDDSGERKKKSSQLYNTAQVEYTKIETDPSPFNHVNLHAFINDTEKDEKMFTYTCNLTIAKFDHQSILKKYEPKKKPGEVNTGMSGVKIQKMPEIRKDADKYSDKVKGFYDILMKHQNDPETRKLYDLKLVMNFTSDAASLPNCTYAALHVINKQNTTKDIDFITEFAFTPECKFTYNPKLMIPDYQFKESFNVVWDSNDIQEKRRQYDENFNMIETILINADEFLQKYPGANESTGNYLVYADEADFLRVAIDDARYFMQNAHYLPKCPCVQCLEDRIKDLDAVISRVTDLKANISKHVEQAQCRPDAEQKYLAALQKMDDTVQQIQELKESKRGQIYNQSMYVCNFVKALEIDKDDEKNKKDDKKDKKEAEEQQESEVERLKKLKKHQINSKMSKEVLEPIYFQDLFYLYGLEHNISENVTQDLAKYYTKAMVKKLKKTNNDCGFLNGSFTGMIKKEQNYTSSKNGTRKGYIELQEQFQSELSLRPETPCDKIENKTKEINKESTELEQKIKSVKTELDKARIAKVLDQLYNQAVDYKRLLEVMHNVQDYIKGSKFDDAAKLIGEEIRMADIKGKELQESLTAKIKAKLDKVDIDTVDRVLDDIKSQIEEYRSQNQDQQQNKDEL